MSEKTVEWKEVRTSVNKYGTFTHQIIWEPPHSNGFIVQYVAVEDEYGLIGNYSSPYYEAWKVKDGIVVHEGAGSDEYDDSFSNEFDGEFIPISKSVQSNVQQKMREVGTGEAFVHFDCLVYWVEEGTAGADEISKWKQGKEIGVSMAGTLRASLEAPVGLKSGASRSFIANFTLDE